MFEEGLKENMVCHEVVGGGRAVFRESLVVLLSPRRDRMLTTVGIRDRRGVVIGGNGVSKSMVGAQLT